VGVVEYEPTRWEENGSHCGRGGKRIGFIEHTRWEENGSRLNLRFTQWEANRSTRRWEWDWEATGSRWRIGAD
jgi:hypothetical protein